MWWNVIELKMPKSLCLLFLIGISSVYAPPFANSSTTRTISCTTAIISTGMFVPIYTVSILQLTMLSWYLRIAFLGDWDFVNHRCQLFCQISKNYSFFHLQHPANIWLLMENGVKSKLKLLTWQIPVWNVPPLDNG